MKAIRISEFGGPEVMKLVEVERPVPAADEILVEVYASSVNPADYIIRQGGNDLLRPFLKLPLGLGLDAAGIVEVTGSEVSGLKVGDRVYGVPNFPGNGSYTEYLAAKASQFALMPKNIPFNEAGAIPSCALIAWNGIMDLGKVRAGQRVLIHGAAGGVGNLAVQFAKAKGAYVIGTASPYNFEFLKEIGADEVLDYRNQTFENFLNSIDLVFNASPVRDVHMRLKSADLLKEGGIFVCTQLVFLAEKEEHTLVSILQHIQQECHANIDKFSKNIIISQIETLLNYADRFYHRQFLTREKTNHQLLERLESLLNDYFNSDDLMIKGLPTVEYIAGELHLSPKYLSDLLRVLTEKGTQQHIHDKLIEKAKEKLSVTDLSVSEIAYELGFKHLQSFSKLFKTKTNQSPLDFRKSFN